VTLKKLPLLSTRASLWQRYQAAVGFHGKLFLALNLPCQPHEASHHHGGELSHGFSDSSPTKAMRYRQVVTVVEKNGVTSLVFDSFAEECGSSSSCSRCVVFWRWSSEHLEV